MFGLFRIKRRKINDNEQIFLKSVLELCGKDFQGYILQIESNLIKGVTIGMSDIPNYVGINYDSAFYKKYENASGKNFKISNIRVKDSLSKQNLDVSIYFSYGILQGYMIENKIKKYQFNNNEIDISSIKKKYIGESYLEILSLLTKQERSNINESEIYISNLNGKDYYHLKELNDGDFLAIDIDNHIYLITHDPFEIKNIDRNELVKLL